MSFVNIIAFIIVSIITLWGIYELSKTFAQYTPQLVDAIILLFGTPIQLINPPTEPPTENQT